MLDVLVQLGLLLALPPLGLGIINKTKAWFAGRKGRPLLQAYFDLAKLLGKSAVYSRTTTWIFRVSPIVALSSALAAGLVIPLACARSPFGFVGDLVAVAYLFGLGRLFTVLAALDTGSSFEAMGASREATLSALAEPALFLAWASLCIPLGALSFEQALSTGATATWGGARPALLAAAIPLFLVLLTENSRIPVDDPNTHLELTMIHEVMVLDHSGVDLAFIQYGSAVKLFVFSSLVAHLLLPIPAHLGLSGLALFLGGVLGVLVVVGVIESTTARFRLSRLPQFLLAASVIAGLGLLALSFRGAS